MVRRFDFGQINLTASADDSPTVPRADTPFCIAILSDLSGRSIPKQSFQDIANCRAVQIDRDSFSEVLAKFGPQLSLPIGENARVSLRFSNLDDFHPDRLFDSVEIFRRLREVRQRLQDPATFVAASEELGVRLEPQAAAKMSAPPESAGVVASTLTPGGLLDEIVERAEGRQTGGRASRAPDVLQDFVRRVTEAHLVAATDPRQAELIGMIDRALSAQMRALLHVPAFQELEAAWRAIYFLVRRIETSPQLKLYLFDISREELAADLGGAQDWHASGIYRLLVEKTVGTPGGEPWAIIVGNYQFGPEREDAELLGRLAKIAEAAGAPILAAASPRLVGCTSLSEAPHPRDWQSPPSPPDAESRAARSALRALPEADWIGLALPRFLLRLPYGKNTDPIESFDFEEMTQPPAHEDYLWGNPAFACALLLAQSFSEDGWDMRSGTHSQIDGLPLHVYEHDGESELKPCAEALLTEEAAERILECGLMPLVSLKGQDAVRLVRFQSIAEPLRALAGRWN